MPTKKSSKKSEPINLVPQWAIAGLVLLDEKRTPIEKGYTTKSAVRYEDPEFDHEQRLKVVQANLKRGSKLGLCPPRGVVILDCDNQKAVDLLLPMLPHNTPSQKRKEGKQHFYLRVDPDAHPFATKTWKDAESGVLMDSRTWGNTDPDLSGGGYAVVPPSISERDGIPYQWETPLPESIEQIPMMPEEMVELLLPHFKKSGRGRKARTPGAGVSRHDLLLSYVARCVSYESASDPEASIARVVKKAEAYARELYADDKGRMEEEIESLQRSAEGAWDQYGAMHALDETTQPHWIGMMISESYSCPWSFPVESSGMLEWSGVHHQEYPNDKMLYKRVEDFVEILHEDAAKETDTDRRKSIRAQATALAAKGSVSAVGLSIKRKYTTSLKDFNVNPDLIAFPNGVVLNTWTGETQEPSSDQMISMLMGAEYDPGARHQMVDDWFGSSFPDENDRRTIEELMGLTLSGRNPQEKIICLHGTQGSGKGTLLFSMHQMLGDYAKMGSSGSLAGKGGTDGSRKDFSVHELMWKLFWGFDEFSGTLDEKAKTYSQSGRLIAPVKYGSDIEFEIRFLIWLATNLMPGVADPQGFVRRLLCVPMNAGAQDVQRLDGRIKNTLTHDPLALSAMLACALRGLDRMRAREWQLDLSNNIQEATSAWAKDSNPIGEWLDAECEVTGVEEDVLDHGFERYITWMDQHRPDRRDYPRASMRAFNGLMVSTAATMRPTFWSRLEHNKRVYPGLRLKKEDRKGHRSNVSKLPVFKKESRE